MIGIIKVITGLALAIATCVSVAMPTTTGDAGYRGDTVTVVISELDPTDLLGVQLRIDYSLDNLEFLSATAGDLGSNFLFPTVGAYSDPSAPLVPIPGSLSAALSIPAFALTAADGGSLLELMFRINTSAAFGPTDVLFSCDDFGFGRPCIDYDFDPVKATVTILQQTTPIPLPGTLPLLGLGVAALWWARRRMA